MSNITTRIAIIKATEGSPNDTCVSNTQWATTPQIVETDSNYVIYILSDFIDETKTPKFSINGAINNEIEAIN